MSRETLSRGSIATCLLERFFDIDFRTCRILPYSLVANVPAEEGRSHQITTRHGVTSAVLRNIGVVEVRKGFCRQGRGGRELSRLPSRSQIGGRRVEVIDHQEKTMKLDRKTFWGARPVWNKIAGARESAGSRLLTCATPAAGTDRARFGRTTYRGWLGRWCWCCCEHCADGGTTDAATMTRSLRPGSLSVVMVGASAAGCRRRRPAQYRPSVLA